jgi:hypothetical protein
MFNPAAFGNIETIKNGIAGSYILIKDALLPEVAESLYDSLQGCEALDAENEAIFKGKTRDGYTYNRLSLDMASDRAPAEIRALYSFLNSRETGFPERLPHTGMGTSSTATMTCTPQKKRGT